jgi:hypothetical protein
MKSFLPLLLLLSLTAACAEDRTVIRGSFAGDPEQCAVPGVSRVHVEGGADTAEVRGCRFRVRVRDSGSVVLAFGDEDDTVGWMYLDHLPARSSLVLERIEIDDRSLAFPGSVALEGSELILINGLRVGNPRNLPARVEVDGLVLSVADEPGLLLVRPADETLPDLRVRLDLAADVFTTAGERGSLATLEFADPVRIEGRARGGVVLARRVVVPAPPPPEEPPPTQERQRPPGVLDELERLLEIFGVRIGQ